MTARPSTNRPSALGAQHTYPSLVVIAQLQPALCSVGPNAARVRRLDCAEQQRQEQNSNSRRRQTCHGFATVRCYRGKQGDSFEAKSISHTKVTPCMPFAEDWKVEHLQTQRARSLQSLDMLQHVCCWREQEFIEYLLGHAWMSIQYFKHGYNTHVLQVFALKLPHALHLGHSILLGSLDKEHTLTYLKQTHFLLNPPTRSPLNLSPGVDDRCPFRAQTGDPRS